MNKMLKVIVISIICICAVITLIFSISWGKSKGEQKEQELLEKLNFGTAQFTNALNSETIILYSIFQTLLEDQTKNEYFDFWKNNSKFTEMLEYAALVDFQKPHEGLRFNPDLENFSKYKLPKEAAEIINEESNNSNDYIPVYFARNGLTVFPIFSILNQPILDMKNSKLMVLKLNSEYILNTMIPALLNRFLPDYEFELEKQVDFTDMEITPNPKKGFDSIIYICDNFLKVFSGSDFLTITDTEAMNGIITFSETMDPSNLIVQTNLGIETLMWFNSTFDTFQLDHDISGFSNVIILNLRHKMQTIKNTARKYTIRSIIISFIPVLLILALALSIFITYEKSILLQKKERNFVATVSHELRTPISVVLSASDNIIKDVIKGKDKIKEYNQIIHKQTNRLSRMVEGILLYSQIRNSSPLSSSFTNINPAEFIHELLDALRNIAESKNCRLTLLLKKDLPAQVKLNPEALTSIIENLIINSITHGAEKCVVNVSSDKSNFIISVVDNGPGIRRAEQKKIFTPFYRGAESIRNHHQGSGLGLFIVKQIIIQEHGTVKVISPLKDKTGTRIEIVYPYLHLPLPDLLQDREKGSINE